MCGRFSLPFMPNAEDLFEEIFGIPFPSPISPPILEESILLPYREITAIHRDADNALVSRPMLWNLVPQSSLEFKPERTWFNIRREKLEQPYSKSLLERRRCIVPAGSFFENKKKFGRSVYRSKRIGGKSVRKKETYEFRAIDMPLFALGGIYDIWKGESEEKYSCSIITLEPCRIIREVHDRMPFIVPREVIKVWLDGSVDDFDLLLGLITPYPSENIVRECIWPENSGQQELF